jgi:hypothetical protein
MGQKVSVCGSAVELADVGEVILFIINGTAPYDGRSRVPLPEESLKFFK